MKRVSLAIVLLSLAASIAHAQPVWQSSATAVGSGGTNATVARPSGTVSGNLLVVGLMFEKGSDETLTPPAGWTLIRRTNISNNAGMATYYKVAGASEPVSYTFGLSGGSKWSIGISRITGVNTSNPIDVSGALTGNGVSVTAPSVTTTVPNTLVLAFYTNRKASTFTPAAGTTEHYDAPNNAEGKPANMMASFAQASAGATGNKTATASETEDWIGQQVALWPADVEITGPTYASSIGSNVFSNPGGAVGPDESACSTVNGGAGAVGFWNFGMAVPATHTVTGVKVEIKASSSAAGPVGPTINIGKDESTLGTEKPITTLTAQACGPGQTVHTFGGPTDLWNLSLTAADVNSPTFTVRIFAGTSPSHQIRLNWIRVTVYHSPPSAPTPGSFNAFEPSTAANAITGVIKTKVAGSAFSLDVAAIENGAQMNGFTNTVSVELLGNNTLGVSLDANNCPTSFTTVQTVSPNPTITKGRSTVNFAAVADSWRDVRVRVRYPTSSPTVTSCSTDNFAIRPNALASFTVTDNTWETAGTGRTLDDLSFTAPPGGKVHKAGRPFSVRATAVNSASVTTNNYTGTPSASLTACAGAACTATFGTLTVGAAAAAGQLSSDVATYDNAGAFRAQLIDSSFASVDAADTAGDCTASGRYVCSGQVDVGRFVPDHFTVTYNTPAFGPACGAFTYLGQLFTYTTAPVITVTARDFAGNAATLYAGNWWRITNTSLTPGTQAARYSAASGSLDVGLLPAPATDPAIAASGSGVGTLTFASGGGLSFTRTIPVAPFNADIALAVNVIDDDGVAHAGNPASFGAATAGNGIAFTAGNKAMRFGRMRILDAVGSDKLDLPIPLRTEYWTGTGFATNTLDNCTTVTAKNFVLSNWQGGLNSANMVTPTAGSDGNVGTVSFSNGVGSVNLLKPNPAATSPGSVDVCVDLDPGLGGDATCQAVTPGDKTRLRTLRTNPPNTYTQDPFARAAFGVYGGQPASFIYQRENY